VSGEGDRWWLAWPENPTPTAGGERKLGCRGFC